MSQTFEEIVENIELSDADLPPDPPSDEDDGGGGGGDDGVEFDDEVTLSGLAGLMMGARKVTITIELEGH